MIVDMRLQWSLYSHRECEVYLNGLEAPSSLSLLWRHFDLNKELLYRPAFELSGCSAVYAHDTELIGDRRHEND